MNNSQQQQADYVTSLSKYIPSLVLHQLIQRQESGRKTVLPELQEMETVCLFADISGFTKVGEACAKKGQRGNEDLAFVINRYMEGMVKNLSKYGGDIIKFVGDAMIVMWPQAKGPRDEVARRTVRQAIQCSLDIQREMHNLTIMADVSALQVKMGIGYGKCALLYVGGVFQRQEFFTVGTALTWALDSEGEATAGGQIIVSEPAFEWVREFYEAREIIKTDKNGKQLGRFYHVTKLIGEGIKADALASKLVADIPQEQMIRLRDTLEGCLAKAIINYLKIGAENFGSETRSLTVMFVSLGIELSSAETEAGMQRIQEVVVTVQEQVYRQQGSINKLMMDDKGSTLICLWGLTPMCHEDDAARSILCAYNMRKALMDKYRIKLSIGISSGEVFAGVCGTSGSRKEFTSLGDVVNLAARVMYWPKSRGIMGEIHTDLTTRNLASNMWSFKPKGHHEFKGKSISLPVYEPIFEIPGDIPYEQTLPREMQKPDLLIESMMKGEAPTTKKGLSFTPELSKEQYLKVHCNPMILDPQNRPSKLLDCESLINVNIRALWQYFNEDFQELNKPFLLAIRGEIGSGKTLFVRNFVETLMKLKRQFACYSKNDSPQFSLFYSSLNSETGYRWLNVWRPILAQMFAFQCQKDKISGSDMLRILLEAESHQGYNHYDKWVCLSKIFDLDTQIPKDIHVNQIKPHKMNFVTAESYTESQSMDMMEILLSFIQLVLGQYDDISEELREEYFSKVKQGTTSLAEMPPFTIVLDTSHLIDEMSWEFLLKVCQTCHRVGIIISMQTDSTDKLVIVEAVKSTFGRVWQSQSLCHLKQLDLPAFDAQTLQKVLVEFSNEYKSSFLGELHAMTAITVPNSIKTKAQGDEWITHFTDLWQLHSTFSRVDDKIIRAVVQKCRGNPLVSLQYFVNLLQNRFIEISENTVVATDLFLKCEALCDFTAVPLPRVAVKINCSFIDTYIRNIQMKVKQRKGEIEKAMRGVVLLKAASVIGEEFELSMLAKIQPLRSENLNGLKTLLRSIEQNDFIEFLDESDSKNALCRFNKTFLRETVYQIILYRDQKKFLHGAIGSYLSEQPPRFTDKGPDPDEQINILKHHLLLNQDQKTEKDLNQQARAGLIIRRITNKIAMNPQDIAFEGFIEKQGASVNAKAEERLVIVTTQWLRWYHDRDEYNGGTFLGSIPLKLIYAVVPARMKTGKTNCFSISTASWYSGKSDKEKDKRDFYFSPSSENLRDEWIAAIEFLRTKAIYENFARQNCAVSFPLKMDDDSQVQEERGVDKGELLFDFGTKFKQKLSVPHPNLNRSVLNKGDDKDSNRGNSKAKVESLADELKLMYRTGMVSFLNHLNLTSVKDSIASQNASIGNLPSTQKQSLATHIRARLGERDQFTEFEDDASSLSDLKRNVSPDSTVNKAHRQLKPGQLKNRRLSIKSDGVINGLMQLHRRNDLEAPSIKEEHEETDEQSDSKTEEEDESFQTRVKVLEKNTQIQPGKKNMPIPSSHYSQGGYHGDSDGPRSEKKGKKQQDSMASEAIQVSMMSKLEKMIGQHLAKGLKEIGTHQHDMFCKQQEEVREIMEKTKSDLMDATMTSQNFSSPVRQQERQFIRTQKRQGAAGITSFRKRGEIDTPASKAPDSEPEDEEQSQSYKEMIMQQDSQTTIEMKQLYSDNEIMRKQNVPQNIEHQRQRRYYVSPDQQRVSTDLKSDLTVKRKYQMGQEQVSPIDRRVQQHDSWQTPEPMQRSTQDRVLVIAVTDCQCKLRDRMMNVPKGSIVEVIEEMFDEQLYRVRYEGLVGQFRMRDFTKNTQAQSDRLEPLMHTLSVRTLQKMSKIAEETQQPSLKHQERQKKKALKQKRQQMQ